MTAWLAISSQNSVDAARKANILTQEAVRGRVVANDFEFMRPLAEGTISAVNFKIQNIGQSEAFYGYRAEVHKWVTLPDGDMPLADPSVTIPIEPKADPVQATVYGTIPDTKQFLDQLPTILEAASRQPKLTSYFYGKVIYETIGRRHEMEFCFLIARQDEKSIEYQAMTGPGFEKYLFYSCPKWNTSS